MQFTIKNGAGRHNVNWGTAAADMALILKRGDDPPRGSQLFFSSCRTLLLTSAVVRVGFAAFVAGHPRHRRFPR